MARLLALLPVLIASLTLGKASDDWPLAGVIAAISTVLSALGPRWEVDRGRRLLTAAMGAGAGYMLVPLLHDPLGGHARALGEGYVRFAAAAILAAAARFLLIGNEGRMLTTTLVFVALLTAGETHVTGYGVFVAVFLVSSLWAPTLRDEYALGSGTSARRLAAGAGVLLLAAGLAAGSTVGARIAYEWLTNRERSSALTWSPRVGFSDRIDLGALDGLLDSDAVVLRVRGPHVDYLRGAVLDSYAGGRWFRSDASEVETNANFEGDTPEGAPGDVVRVTALADQTERFFLPLNTRSLVTFPGPVVVDGVGAVKRNAKRGPNDARFLVGERNRAEPKGPDAVDLQLPRAIRGRLEALASEWVAPVGEAATTTERLDAIERHFKQEFHYARTFARVGGPDPALDFLFGNRNGHCEYFATGMALVARAAGIPARFVAGYRVGEQSPFGYHVVRERNAHAWVEAWVPGQGWTTRDPTPDADLPQNDEHRSGYLASLSDALRLGYDDLVDWLERRTLGETAIAWVAGFAVLVWIVARGVRRGNKAAHEASEEGDGALPFLALLLSTLARAGFEHDGHEPIERLAARLDDPDGARLLTRYAALRYGGIGDAETLAADVAAYARQALAQVDPRNHTERGDIDSGA